MAECIAMAIGFVFGAACVMFAQMKNAKCKMQNLENGETTLRTVNKDGEREQMQKQWENFLNYNGTSSGQIPIGDDE